MLDTGQHQFMMWFTYSSLLKLYNCFHPKIMYIKSSWEFCTGEQNECYSKQT